MSDSLAARELLRAQYRDSTNLDARIALHARFSTATNEFHRWVFDHFHFAPDARVLEIGCGNGILWAKNRARVAPAWQLSLADFSLGMVETARQTLATHSLHARFANADAQALPFPRAFFDAVIANHMLYHVANRPRALGEIRRVLKKHGALYATTIGEKHLQELGALMDEFGIERSVVWSDEFGLENGAAQLGEHFARVERFDFDDGLRVTEVEPIVAYVLSTSSNNARQVLQGERLNEFRRVIAQRIARDGAFHITKASGLYIASEG